MQFLDNFPLVKHGGLLNDFVHFLSLGIPLRFLHVCNFGGHVGWGRPVPFAEARQTAVVPAAIDERAPAPEAGDQPPPKAAVTPLVAALSILCSRS